MAKRMTDGLFPTEIEVDGMICRVIRSTARRSVCVRVAADAVPEILAPAYVKAEELRLIAGKYSDWLREHIAERENLNASREGFTLHIGDRLRCLGGERILREADGNHISYNDEAFYVPRRLDRESLRAAVVQVYKLLAGNHLKERTAHFARLMGLSPSSVKINSAKSHWGTCSARGSINYTWYTMMADREAVDYIVIHELCHMKHFDHSPEFWSEVAEYCPDYTVRKERLKTLWREIQRENWG